jgi:NhaP-type Na+/H+ or K+/H+ antiporter
MEMAISLALIVVLGLAADIVFRKFKLPGLVGMLIVGVLVGPHVVGLMRPEMMAVSADFRRIALIVILLRAGFELRRDTLHRVGKTALIMSAFPAIMEIAAVMAVAPYFLKLTLLEAIILGTILAAVSPAVVVPLMIDFMERGKGAKKGIPTMILAASSVDDVFVIVLFTIFLGMYGGHKVNIAWQLAGIPISVILGIIVGLIPGYLLYRLFLKYDWQPPRRTLLVMGTSICLMWLEEAAHGIVPIAALLGVMAIGFIILEKEENVAHIISQKLKRLWVFAELLLFVLVGAQVNVSVAWKAGAAGLAVIFIGLVARSLGTYVSVLGTDYNWKERLFCVVAYIPKATVQAAIGAVPLEAGVAGGEVILAVAVLSILVTAPLGAIGIMLMGEPILEEEKVTAYRFKTLREKLQLPRVGERVRNKTYGTMWKIIEEKEVWLEVAGAEGLEPGPMPAIYLRYWKPDSGSAPGTGKTMEYRYSYLDSSFHANWEIMYD